MGENTSIEDIAKNVGNVTETISIIRQKSSSSVDLMEKLGVVLEELRTISVLTDTQTIGLKDQLQSLNKDIATVEKVFDNIDFLRENIEKKKSEMTKLEKICTYLERA